LPDGITFHALRRTYARSLANTGDPQQHRWHRDPRMTLRVYTDRNAAEDPDSGLLGEVIGH
jgi:integrase